MSFDEWMTDAETNTGDLKMYGKKKMMSGGRSSMDTGKRPGQRLMPDARQAALKKAMYSGAKSMSAAGIPKAVQKGGQRLGKASGGKMKYGHGGGVSGNAAARREGKAMGGAMKTSKPC